MAFRLPDPALSAPREAALAALRELERKRQVDGEARQREAEARFRADLRKPRKRGPAARVILVLVHAVIGAIAGGNAGYYAWDAEWFGQTKGDLAGGLNMAFDLLVGMIGGLIAFAVLGLLLTRKTPERKA
jgi:hypothetical protein